MADLIITNANILTMDQSLRRCEALAVKHGRIIGLGRVDEVMASKTGATKVLDLEGRTLLPGFIDPHLHLRSMAESLVILDLGPQKGVSSIQDIKQKLADATETFKPGSWIRAGGFNDAYLKEGRYPNKNDLDEAAPHHPVKLTHRSGHDHVLNSRALETLGINKYTEDPPGGVMERELETGQPTGLFFGAGDWLARLIPALEPKELDQGIELAGKQLLAAGHTTVQDASPRNDIQRFNDLAKWKNEELLKSRIRMAIGFDSLPDIIGNRFKSEFKANQLTAQGVKIVIDESMGRLYPDQDDLNSMVLDVHKAGGQLIMHAVEEPAIEAACIAVENAQNKIPRSDHRHRVEHCSVCSDSLIKRLAGLDMSVVSHPAFLFYSGQRYLKTVAPDDLKHLYPFKSLLANGVNLAAASDAPLAGVNPLLGIYSAVSRKAASGEVISAGEAVDVEASIRMYTSAAACAITRENDLGEISVGKLADLVALSQDPLEVEVDEIKNIRATMTIINGEIVWEADR